MKKRWFILIPGALIVGLAVILTVQFFHPKVIIYNEYLTYTTKDDQEIYLNRFPTVYYEGAFPWNYFSPTPAPSSLTYILDQVVADSARHQMYFTNRYNYHFNLDCSIQKIDDQIIITYMGYGKLQDGTIETIDIKESYPEFRFEDQTQQLDWKRPPNSWDLPIPNDLQDPSKVIDPKLWDNPNSWGQ